MSAIKRFPSGVYESPDGPLNWPGFDPDSPHDFMKSPLLEKTVILSRASSDTIIFLSSSIEKAGL